MAIDGLVLSNIVYELQENLIGGKIDKINQPEKDELIFSIRCNKVNHKLLLTTEASNPRIHLTNIVKENPMTPPALCMLFRKHLVGGKIIDIKQINMDRVVVITIEHFDEMNDIRQKRIIIEIMGRHSNIILVNEDNLILESIKRVSSAMSSFREVFPGRSYSAPPGSNKMDPLTISSLNRFKESLIPNEPVVPSLYKSFYGFSSMIGDSLCIEANIDGSNYVSQLSDQDMEKLYFEFQVIVNEVKNRDYKPYIILDQEGLYIDFHDLSLTLPNNPERKYVSSISALLDDYYETRALQVRMKQKTLDMRKLVQTHLDRSRKKLELQEIQLKDTKDKDKFKLKGELIQANMYQIPEGASSIEVLNYYTNENMVITLNPNLTANENAIKAFEKYNKKKRTELAIAKHIKLTKKEIDHLASIQFSLENIELNSDLIAIRKELVASGYIRFRQGKEDKRYKAAKPLHFISSDGFDIYVGRNNEQNEYLTLKMANNSDWWFHAKDIPGSHVIVIAKGEELPDRTYEEAAALAAYYSKSQNSTKVTVDYVQKKHLKKPTGSPMGYVIYHTNFSMHIAPSKNNLNLIEE